MQLSLGSDPRTAVLREVQSRLVETFGHIDLSERRREPFWTLVQGVIGARTKSETANAATDRLLAKYGSWETVAAAPLEQLQRDLATQTYPNMAAERLKNCLSALVERCGAADLSHLEELDTEAAMRWLEHLPGVARKISAGVMNASSFARRALVIDGHHRRIVQRMGLVPAKADTTRTEQALTPVMPEEWSAATWDEHHLLMKKLGQNFCRPSAPDCIPCPVRSLCETGRGRAD